MKANKPVTVKQIDFLTSSEAHISSMELTEPPSTEAMIPIDYKKVTELFNAPRPDKNHYDHAGPAALRLLLMANGHEQERADLAFPAAIRKQRELGSTDRLQDFHPEMSTDVARKRQAFPH